MASSNILFIICCFLYCVHGYEEFDYDDFKSEWDYYQNLTDDVDYDEYESDPSIHYSNMSQHDYEFRSTEVDVTRTGEFPFMASLQRSPGYRPLGLPAVFVTPKYVLSIYLVARAMQLDFFRRKKLVVVSGSLDPAHSGKIHKVRTFVSDPTGFAMLKVSPKFKRFVRPAPKSYTISPYQPLTVLRWKSFSSKLTKKTGVHVKPRSAPCNILGVSFPFMGCLAQESLFITDVCAPVLNSRKMLVGMVAIPSLGVTGSEYFYKISEIVTNLINIARG